MGAQETTVDVFLGGRLEIEQPARGYRAGIDAVLLAATVPVLPSVLPPAGGRASLLDVGAGVGTVGLAAAVCCPGLDVTLVERAPELAALACRNVGRNGLEARVRVVEADIGGSAGALQVHGLAAGRFDYVVANPPYHDAGRGTAAPDPLKAGSHAMAEADLDTWLRFMTRMAKPSGRLTIVHKAEALGALLAAMSGRCGALTVLPIHPRVGEAAHRILVAGIKGSRAPSVLLPALVLHGEGNGFRPEVDRVFREGARLRLDDGRITTA